MHGGHTFAVSEPINDKPATCANGATIGFACSSPEKVQELHDAAVANGGRASRTRRARAKTRWA